MCEKSENHGDGQDFSMQFPDNIDTRLNRMESLVDIITERIQILEIRIFGYLWYWFTNLDLKMPTLT